MEVGLNLHMNLYMKIEDWMSTCRDWMSKFDDWSIKFIIESNDQIRKLENGYFLEICLCMLCCYALLALFIISKIIVCFVLKLLIKELKDFFNPTVTCTPSPVIVQNIIQQTATASINCQRAQLNYVPDQSMPLVKTNVQRTKEEEVKVGDTAGRTSEEVVKIGDTANRTNKEVVKVGDTADETVSLQTSLSQSSTTAGSGIQTVAKQDEPEPSFYQEMVHSIEKQVSNTPQEATCRRLLHHLLHIAPTDPLSLTMWETAEQLVESASKIKSKAEASKILQSVQTHKRRSFDTSATGSPLPPPSLPTSLTNPARNIVVPKRKIKSKEEAVQILQPVNVPAHKRRSFNTSATGSPPQPPPLPYSLTKAARNMKRNEKDGEEKQDEHMFSKQLERSKVKQTRS